MLMIANPRRYSIRPPGLAAAALALSFTVAQEARAQEPPPAVNVSFGIDTTISDIGAIVRLVRAYLAKPDSSARSRGLWSTATDFDRRVGDMTTEAYQGFPATIVSLASDGPGDSVFVVRVLYANADSRGLRISPLAMQRLFAVRESGSPFGFRLSGALPRLTRDWERRSQGRVTFWYAPGQHPNPSRITHASAFVDSVAALFHVPAPNHIDMYVAGSMEEAQRAIGLDFFPEASADRGRGGRGGAGNTVLSGNPALGEAYEHELAHVILGPTFPSRNRLFNEGVATWLGGSRGRTTHQVYERLHQIQAAHPALTIAQVLTSDAPDVTTEEGSELFYATGALIVDSVYRQTGIAGLRSFAQVNNDPKALLAALPTQLGLVTSDRDALDRWWRAQAALNSGTR
ncbi:MAG: hypothetical protein ABI408_00905 [Gemmatimonadaceae bacterium]